jgi:hypothetical protein
MAVDKQEIEELFLKWFAFSGKVSISDTGLVSVTGSVKLQKKCDQLPVSFDRVGDDFSCIFTGLKKLAGAPRWVGGGFFCWGNQLKTLEGSPRWVGREFNCSSNQLEPSLVGAPQWIGSSFSCRNNRLKTLEGGPRWVGGGFDCCDNPLEVLTGIPLYIGNYFSFNNRKKLPLCGMLTSRIKDIAVDINPPELESIIFKYLNTGYQGMIPFASELIRAGYGDNAWL